MKRLLMMVVSACVLAFAGCVTSPFLDEDAAKRMAAVDALSEQRKLVEVALDYCTEPYQELPTGCQMDVRRRAVERLTGRDLLVAVASFSIVKATVNGKSCLVALGEPNAELRKLALEKLTEDKYIPSLLAAKDPFAIQPVFSKALFGHYQIAGQQPETAKDAWFEMAKGKEKSVAKAFCACLGSDVPTELCQQVFALLPAALSSDTKDSIKSAYKQAVVGASSVNAAVRVLQLAAVVPADAVVKDDVDAMCKRISSKVSTAEEFTAFGTLVNGKAKRYLADPESLIKDAATRVVPNLNGMNELAAFAEVLKTLDSPWIGQIGIEDAVRKFAASVNNIGGIKVFAGQLASFNTVMLPNKTDISGDAVIAVLDAIVEGRAVATAAAGQNQSDKMQPGKRSRRVQRNESSRQGGQKETIEDFVRAVSEFSADLLSDKAIIAIFENKGLNDAYSRAIRSDGYREDMGNEIAGAAMKSGSFGDMLAAGLLMSAMGDKESPKFTKLYSHLVNVIRAPETFIKASSLAKIYYPRNMVIEAAEKKIDSQNYAKCLLAVFKNFPDSSWCIGKTLTSGESFVGKGDESALSILQPAFHAYTKTRNTIVFLRAIRCFNDAEEIETQLQKISFEVLEKANCRSAYMLSFDRLVDLYKKSGQLDKSAGVLERVSNHLVEGMNSRCEYLRKAEFAFPREVATLMGVIGKDYPVLWAKLMLKAKIPPYSVEFEKVVSVLENDPSLLADFLSSYECEPYEASDGKPLAIYKKECDYIPIYYYDCEWYWKALCVASGKTLSAEDRTRLNKKMVFFAINGLEPDARKEVTKAIIGDADVSLVRSAWSKVRENIPANTTALFNLSLDESLSKMKWEKLWNEKYKNKRIQLRGKVLEVGDSKLILDGGSDVTDMKFADKLPSENVNPSLRFAVDNADQKLKSAEDDVKNAKMWYDTKKNANLPYASEEKRLKEAEAKLAALQKKASAPLKVILKYTLEVPERYSDAIADLKKGDEVIFEAYPYRVYPRSSTDDVENRTRTFTARMREGRIVNEKD